MLFPPEAPCERVGSIMRCVWEPRRKLNPKVLEDLVLLSGAGVRCTGSERDELLVQTVVHVLLSSSKNSLWASPDGGLPPLHTQLPRLDCADSGRFAEGSGDVTLQPSDIGLGVGYSAKREFIVDRRHAGTPSGLPEAAQRGVRTATASGLVAPLPLDVPGLHALQKGHAGSSLKTKAVTWLESEAGKEWLKERSELFTESRGGVSPPEGDELGDQGGVSPPEAGHAQRPQLAPKKKARRHVGPQSAPKKKA